MIHFLDMTGRQALPRQEIPRRHPSDMHGAAVISDGWIRLSKLPLSHFT
jgi:hypothetical protein